MGKRRVRVWIKGRVQGVFFRAYTREAAVAAGVSGFVRNLPDGTVEAVFEGDEERVNGMIKWCWKGSPLSRVESVDVREEVCLGDHTGFQITYRGGEY